MDEMRERHAEEVSALRKKAERLRSSIPRKERHGKARAAEEIASMEKALADRHAEEWEDEGFPPPGNATEDITESACEHLTKTDESSAHQKNTLSKKQRRKLAKEAQQRLDEEVRRKEKDAAGPSDMELEDEAFRRSILLPNNWSIHFIQPDGDCLYAAISHQLGSVSGKTVLSPSRLRAVAADRMESNRAEFEPFLDDTDADSYEAHIACVRDTHAWGGQLEARAIAEALEITIEIYAPDLPVIRMGAGSASGAATIRLSYHRKSYGLGEHYNSLVPSR